MALKKSTKALIRIAKRERPKALKFYTQQMGMTKKAARKTHADFLRGNRRSVGSREARNLIFKGHGYAKHMK